MTIFERLSTWKETGAIRGAQYDMILAIVRKDRFSVFFELNSLLYLGVLSLIAGAGWVIQVYAANLGDAAIISCLTKSCSGRFIIVSLAACLIQRLRSSLQRSFSIMSCTWHA